MVTGLPSEVERKRGTHPDVVHVSLAADADMPLSCPHFNSNSVSTFTRSQQRDGPPWRVLMTARYGVIELKAKRRSRPSDNAYHLRAFAPGG
jgi:hypothetical protein